jgi:lipoyl(octanoyl) transferase
MNTWRVIFSGYKDPYYNMAMDEALFEAMGLGYGQPTLRIYGWEPAAFSLGYSHDPAVNLDLKACLRYKVPFVRRITGGGVLFHGGDISYSIVSLYADLPEGLKAGKLFKIICSFLITMYRSMGINAEFAVDSEDYQPALKPKRGAPVFCPDGKEKYDIVINGKKLGGNAQKRGKDVFLQHGSIPLSDTLNYARLFLKENVSSAVSRPFSLEELSGKIFSFSGAETILLESFQDTFGIIPADGELNKEERGIFESLRVRKYQVRDWNMYGRMEVSDVRDETPVDR